NAGSRVITEARPVAYRGPMREYYRRHNGGAVAVPTPTPTVVMESGWSYKFLLAFLMLLYANTPFLLPQLEVLRPAKIVAVMALIALLSETVFGSRSFDFAMPEGIWLIVFMGAAALSCITALWPGFAFTAVNEMLKMALVFFFLVNCLTSEKKVRGVMWVMMIGGLFPALGTLHNYKIQNLNEGRAAWVGIFANPNEVAYSLVVLLPLAAYLAYKSGWLARVFLAGISLLFIAATFVTFSRGGLIGMVAVVEFFALRKKKIWLQIAIGVMVAGGAILAQHYWSRGQDFSSLNNDLSFQQRIITSQAGIRMLIDHPALGVGIACSVVAWPLYAPQGVYTRGALITHNTFVQVFGETGLLGGIPFLFFLGTGLRSLRRNTAGTAVNDLGMAIEAAIWGFVVCGMSGGYVVTWFPYILYGLAAAAGRIPGSLNFCAANNREAA
ncbi:MAG: O-antigen ligase family protein, partial [Acidobacteriota bacterium]|nr:O-antigen ligase family protein [Acidobacteriota bacterium]